METSVTLDNIIFEHRNKDYGAYELRKTYTSILNRAMWISISIFSALFIILYIFANRKETIKKMTDVILHLQQNKEQKWSKEIELAKFEKFMETKIVDSTKIEEALPAQAELEVAIISNFDKNGTENNIIMGDAQASRLSHNTWIYDHIFVFTCAEPIDSTMDIPPPAEVDFMETEGEDESFLSVCGIIPSFAGGVNEMLKFLSKTLKYPVVAQNANIEGRVYVSFIVEKDGRITNVQVMKGIGFGCDEEATRAVKLMPKWIPGQQNGKNVRVKFTLPVTFRLE